MNDYCPPENERKHLAIIGGGSAAFAAAIRAREHDARVTIVNDGLPMGGTCVNVGCVPSKTLLRAAATFHGANAIPFAGIRGSAQLLDFAAVRAQKDALVTDLRQAKYLDIVASDPNVRLIEGRARFVSADTVEVGDEKIRADRFLIATGVRPFIPDVPGLAQTPYLTNESAFMLDRLPESMIVLGGRYIALELAQMFARFGTQVTILQRSRRILPDQMPDVSHEIDRLLAGEGINIVTGVKLTSVRGSADRAEVEAQVDGISRLFIAERVLVATGRRPNTDDLGTEAAGVGLDARGFISVNEALQTSNPAVYGAGDVTGGYQFVYVAAYEGALAAENALFATLRPTDYRAVPWVVFTDPQIAGVGMDEAQADAAGFSVDTAVLPMTHLPRALAARDTRGFIKLIRNRKTDQLIGARVVAPEASELLMELVLAIKYAIPVSELRTTFHPYLTLGEAVKLAAISFDKSVDKLSCCAT